MNEKVSIVVPIYNGENFIDGCVKNLLSLKYDNLEFILVDDGSTDGTAKACDEIAARDDRFKIIHQVNSGPSKSRNAGTSAATGKYLLYFDVDDDLDPNAVEDNVKLAVKEDADIVMFSFWYHNLDTGKKWNNALGKDFCGDDKEFFDKYLISAIDREIYNAPWNKLFKLSFLRDNDLHFLPEYSIYEDALFVSMTMQYAGKLVVNDKPYYTYKLRKTGSLITKYVDCYFDSVTRLYDEALKYCSKYENNEAQIRRFSELYATLVTTNLKQISCNKDLSNKQKRELISNICDNPKLRKAMTVSKLEKKKSFVKSFVLSRNINAIILMYKLIGGASGYQRK